MSEKPSWLKTRYSSSPNRQYVEELLDKLQLNTVCEQANCPNYGECFSKKTATFMILGTNCTRNCRFCGVQNADPTPVDPDEPERVAQAVKELGLGYVVITSVTRDDLPDGGAGHFASVIAALRRAAPNTAVEVLIPDFMGSAGALKLVIDAAPDVICHNMETVPALYPQVRPGADYARSLAIFTQIKAENPAIFTKSGIMLGLGETREQVEALLSDLRQAGCESLTIGQYMSPTKCSYPVSEYITPEQFEQYGQAALAKGFAFVASAPLVRSSYRAGDALATLRAAARK